MQRIYGEYRTLVCYEHIRGFCSNNVMSLRCPTNMRNGATQTASLMNNKINVSKPKEKPL